MQKWIRDFLVSLPCFWIPGRTDLVVVLNYILIGPIERDRERGARAARRRLEASVAGDQVVGKDSTIAPAANSQPIRVGNTHLDHVIDTGLQVLNLVMPPVSEN